MLHEGSPAEDSHSSRSESPTWDSGVASRTLARTPTERESTSQMRRERPLPSPAAAVAAATSSASELVVVVVASDAAASVPPCEGEDGCGASSAAASVGALSETPSPATRRLSKAARTRVGSNSASTKATLHLSSDERASKIPRTATSVRRASSEAAGTRLVEGGPGFRSSASRTATCASWVNASESVGNRSGDEISSNASGPTSEVASKMDRWRDRIGIETWG